MKKGIIIDTLGGAWHGKAWLGAARQGKARHTASPARYPDNALIKILE